MQVTVEKVESKEEEQAIIRAVEETGDIRAARELLEGGSRSIPVTKDGQVYVCKLSSIYYIESVDKKTFVYTKEGCFESKKRLYELEEELGGLFMRCSKAMILNLKKVKNVHSEMSGRLNAILLNDETVVISRGYVKDIKRRLGIG